MCSTIVAKGLGYHFSETFFQGMLLFEIYLHKLVCSELSFFFLGGGGGGGGLDRYARVNQFTSGHHLKMYCLNIYF